MLFSFFKYLFQIYELGIGFYLHILLKIVNISKLHTNTERKKVLINFKTMRDLNTGHKIKNIE